MHELNAYGAIIFICEGIVALIISRRAKRRTSNTSEPVFDFERMKSFSYLKRLFVFRICTTINFDVVEKSPLFISIVFDGIEMFSTDESANASEFICEHPEFFANSTFFNFLHLLNKSFSIRTTLDGIEIFSIGVDENDLLQIVRSSEFSENLTVFNFAQNPNAL